MKFLKAAALAHLLMMSASEASDLSASAESAAPASAEDAPGEVPSSTESTAPVDKKTRAPKDPSKILDIMNGRMPLPLVYLIRFVEDAGAKTSDLAKAYGTSVGKVFDIRKGSNFTYVTKDYLPSQEELDAAKAFVTTNTSTTGKSLKDLGGAPDAIIQKLGALTVATAEQVAQRNWTVKTVGVKKEAGDEGDSAKPAKTPRKPKAKSEAAAAPVAAGANMF